MTVEKPLITKYRPEGWGELIGNETMYAALRKTIVSDVRPHSYLFTGPAGTGKTTTARIVATELGADVTEIDAASFSGVDDARQLVELGQHRSLGGGVTKMFIIDECHALSKPAWQALLKLLEEPPAHLYLALCTTELNKVPETIKQRCFHVLLRPVSGPEMEELVAAVAELEQWRVAPDVLQAIVSAAQGSPRKALTTLQAVHDAIDRDEVRRIIQLQDNSEPVIEIIQHLLKGGKVWNFIQPLLLKLDADDFDGNLIAVARYITAWMNNAKTDTDAKRAWLLLDMLIQPAGTPDAKSIFYAAVGRMLWGV